MPAPYILARTFAEAHAFGRGDLGLDPGCYRVVNSAGTLKSVRGATLYLLPGWRQRFDRFKMQTALRWTRMEVVDLDADPELVPKPVEAVAETSERVVTPDEVEEFFAVIDAQLAVAEPFDTATPQHPVPATEKPEAPRRRRRCKECGVLVEPDDVDAHAAEHAEAE